MKRYLPLGWLASMLFFVIGFINMDVVSAANELNQIRIEVELQQDGSAIINEFRQMYLDEGTENFIVFDEDDMNGVELLDFSVVGFTEEPDWDSGDSREEKAGKYGIIDTNDGFELVWGVGEYGEQNYQLTYSLANFVQQLEDGQSLYWDFDTFPDLPAESVTLEITGPFSFTLEDVNFWGFGFEGDIQLIDGNIVWESFHELDSHNDVRVLAQFPNSPFDTTVTNDLTLQEQAAEATETAMTPPEQSEELSPLVIGLITFGILAGVTGIGSGVTYSVKVSKAKKAAGALPDGYEFYVKNDEKQYKEIPFTDKNLPGISFFIQNLYKGYFEDYFFAYLLKWELDGNIRTVTGEPDEFEETIIEILNFTEESIAHPRTFPEIVEDIKEKREPSYEKGLWTMLLDAADEAGIVTEDSIRDWGKDHGKEVQVFQDSLVDYSKDYLQEHGYLIEKEIEVWGRKQKIDVPTEAGTALLDRLTQFDNYLAEAEFLDLEEETNLSFSDFMFWNILFSRRDEVTDRFDELREDGDYYYHHDQFHYYYGYWYGMSGFRDNMTKGLASGGFHSHNASMYNGSSGSSGSGGFTSTGGGGGAGGASGGGVR